MVKIERRRLLRRLALRVGVHCWVHNQQFLEKLPFRANGEPYTMSAGASIWLPRGIPRIWANATLTEPKPILVCQPGGFEKFFEEIGNKMAKANSASAEQHEC